MLHRPRRQRAGAGLLIRIGIYQHVPAGIPVHISAVAATKAAAAKQAITKYWQPTHEP